MGPLNLMTVKMLYTCFGEFWFLQCDLFRQEVNTINKMSVHSTRIIPLVYSPGVSYRYGLKTLLKMNVT